MSPENETVSERVIQAVATTSSADPLELPPLYDAVDPDALDSLVTEMTDGEVVFAYAGYEVTVRSDGTIMVDETTADRASTGTAAASN